MLTRITSFKAALIIAILGVVVFSTGLTNQFAGDDQGQIVDNVAVHSITNVPAFFQGSTFYNGSGQVLTGKYYRPLMTTVFSLLYTLFGPQPVAFHLLQLLLHMLGTFILFL